MRAGSPEAEQAPYPFEVEAEESVAREDDSWFGEPPADGDALVVEAALDEDFWMPPSLNPVGRAPVEPLNGTETTEPARPVQAELSAFDAEARTDLPAEVLSSFAAESTFDQAASASADGTAGDMALPAAGDDLDSLTSVTSESGSIEIPDIVMEAPLLESSEIAAQGVEPAPSLMAEFLNRFTDGAPAETDLVDEPETVSAAAEGMSMASMVEVFPDPTIGHTPTFNTVIPESASAPFVTETLAELYLQQGFRGEALTIYRQLLKRDPTDRSLQRRIDAIEQGEPSDVLPEAIPASPEALASQSVRSLGGSRAGCRPALANRAASRTALNGRGGPVGRAVSSSRESALADYLRVCLRGKCRCHRAGGRFRRTRRPAVAAERELSLDHLFRDVCQRLQWRRAGRVPTACGASRLHRAAGSAPGPGRAADMVHRVAGLRRSEDCRPERPESQSRDPRA